MPTTKSDIRTAPALFTHVPRPPHKLSDENHWQRRFGGFHALVQRFAGFAGTDLQVVLFRDAARSQAEMTVSLTVNNREVQTTTVTLTADELQTLACAMLDAAHDLRSQPAILDRTVPEAA